MTCLLLLFIIPILGKNNIPGLSEMAAVGLSDIEPTSIDCIQDSESESCIAKTIEINKLRDEMGENATLARSYVHSTNAVAIVMKNSRGYPIYYHWLDDKNIGNTIYQGRLNAYGTTATLSYITHKFFFTKEQNHGYNEKIHEIYVNGNENLFIVPPNNKDRTYDNDYKHYLQLKKENEWRTNYEKRTGYPWLSHYSLQNGPRQATELPMYEANNIGDIYEIESKHGYWNCVPENSYDFSCQSREPVKMKMEVMSTHPPIFKILNTISDTEADLIVNISKPKLYRSSVGGTGVGMVSTVRTSFNGRLGKNDHPIVNTIYQRANDIFGFDKSHTYNRFESLQVLHYAQGQEYLPHHDFGESGSPKQRVFTLLFYLNNQLDSDSGGETSFPKAMGHGVALHPGKGNSVMFYSAMKDGNSNDLSLHAALPVKKGEKWACNFWIWD